MLINIYISKKNIQSSNKFPKAHRKIKSVLLICAQKWLLHFIHLRLSKMYNVWAIIQTISWYNWNKFFCPKYNFLHISIGHKDFGKDWQSAIYDNSGSPNTVRLKVAKCIHRADKYIIVYWLGEPFFMV